MAYINVDQAYPTHRKTMRLKAILGNDADIFPIRMWCWCSLHSPENGSFGDMNEIEIAYALGYFGNPKSFMESMIKTGFMRQENGEFRCCGWLDHNGHIAAFSIRGKEAAKARWMNKTHQNACSNAKTKTSIAISNTPTNQLTNQLTNIGAVKPRIFIPPTLEEIAAYCKERKNNVDPSRWRDFYSSKGWMIGKNKMKDWRAAVRTWENNSKIEPKSEPIYYRKFPDLPSVKEFK